MSCTRAIPATSVILLPEGTEPRLKEAVERGYLSHVVVEIDGDRLYPVVFYTLERLQGELEASCRHAEHSSRKPE